jgi:hypothetical protein
MNNIEIRGVWETSEGLQNQNKKGNLNNRLHRFVGPVTTSLHVLGLRMEETTSRYGG